MDVGTIVSWIQLVLWSAAFVFGAFKFIEKWRAGGFMQAISLPRSSIYPLLIVGLVVSAISLYFNYHPKVVQVERIVEKPVPVPCPEPSKGLKQDKSQKKPSQQQSGKDNVQTGPITQGPCSALQLGGSQNQ